MEQKQLPPRNSYTGHLECSLMMSLSKSGCVKMTRCSLRKIVFTLLCEPLATSKLCVATIAAKLKPEASRKATLFFGRSVRQESQQVDAKVGRPLPGETSHEAQRCPPRDRRWHSGEQLLEY